MLHCPLAGSFKGKTEKSKKNCNYDKNNISWWKKIKNMNPFDTILITFIILIIFYFIFSKYTAQHLSEILTLVGGIGLTISSIQANSIEKFFGETTWKDSTTYIMCVSALISLIGIIVSIYRRSKQNTIENILNENSLK